MLCTSLVNSAKCAADHVLPAALSNANVCDGAGPSDPARLASPYHAIGDGVSLRRDPLKS
jgi:hypothetical protein